MARLEEVAPKIKSRKTGTSSPCPSKRLRSAIAQPLRSQAGSRSLRPSVPPDLTWDVVYGDGQDEQRDSPPAAAAGGRQVPSRRCGGGGALGVVGSCRLLPLVGLAILTLV